MIIAIVLWILALAWNLNLYRQHKKRRLVAKVLRSAGNFAVRYQLVKVMVDVPADAHVWQRERWERFKRKAMPYRKFATYNLYEERYVWHDISRNLCWGFIMHRAGLITGWK
jgi:hypothetical protein